MYQNFKQYFEVSRREFRGMLVFVILLALVYILPYVYEKLTFEPVKVILETMKPKIVEIESFKQQNAYADNHNEEAELISKAILFNFNPNNLPLEDWMKLGLSEKQANSIKNYEAKGGKFRNKVDVKKMYAISDNMYQKIEPYIQISGDMKSSFSKFETTSTEEKSKPDYKTVIVDINQADSTELLNIKGVGPAFASRIIKYRNRLGGFYTKEQIREIYGMDSIKYAQIENQVSISNLEIRKIKVNECTFEDLKLFPYLTYKQMNAIIAFRKQHGNYKSVEDLNKIAILNPQIIQKIMPYLSF